MLQILGNSHLVHSLSENDNKLSSIVNDKEQKCKYNNEKEINIREV